jgi:selenocysteine-specific translation elongation factor
VLNIALVSSEDLARRLGKRGDVRDVESYVHKEEREGQARTLSFLRPLRYPERLRPLLSALDVARAGVIEVQRVDAALGESMVAFGCAGISSGHAIIAPEEGGWVDADQVRLVLEQAGLGDWSVHEGELDEHALRESLYELQSETTEERATLEAAPLVLPVDQHFNVKGVGLVAIGYVQSGTVSKHDAVEVLPAGESGVARSLQVMDDDVDSALAGDRVGVALRGLREEALHRGCMLAHPDSGALSRHDASSISLERAPFQKRELAVGDVVHAAADLQFVVGRVTETSGTDLSVTWDAPLWLRADGSSRIVIAQLDAEPMRIMGVVRSIHPAG